MDGVKNRYSLHEDLNTLEYQVYEHNKDKDIQDKSITMNYSFMTDIELNDLKETLLYFKECEDEGLIEEYSSLNNEKVKYAMKSLSRVIERFSFSSPETYYKGSETNQPRSSATISF